MGKYIVELKKNETLYKATTRESDGTAYVCSAIGTPYTAPDLEQVRKKAYQKGYETGYEDGYNEPGKNQQEAYQRGLNDAWDAAKKIGNMPYDEEEKAFGLCGWVFIAKHTASEAIEKIRQYEQEKGKIQIGDEVEAVYGKAVVIEILGNNKSVIYMYHNASTGVSGIDKVTKTGRHFPEIATVLEKMRGEQDG